MYKKKINILIIGKNSYISKNYIKLSKLKKNIELIKHSEIKKINFNKFTHVINFSIDPKIYLKRYNLTNRIDEKICNLIKNKNLIYIFPSSRLIYKRKSLINNNIFKKKNFYANNKSIIEKKIIKSRKKKKLILRIANILNFNLDQTKLFIPKLLYSLKKKNLIKFDLNKSSYKDFITFDYFTKCLDILIKEKKTGTFNISSGKKVNIHQLGKSIINGFGKGQIFYKDKLYRDSFVLSNKKIKKIVKIDLSKKEILNYSFNMGKRLKY